MAGWSMTVGPTGVLQSRNPDSGDKVAAFPAVGAGNAAWWREFAWQMKEEFARQALLNGPNINNLQFTATNGNGDTNGIGTLTITIVTS